MLNVLSHKFLLLRTKIYNSKQFCAISFYFGKVWYHRRVPRNTIQESVLQYSILYFRNQLRLQQAITVTVATDFIKTNGCHKVGSEPVLSITQRIVPYILLKLIYLILARRGGSFGVHASS